MKWLVRAVVASALIVGTIVAYRLIYPAVTVIHLDAKRLPQEHPSLETNKSSDTFW